jgi:TRAP-type uncharacterized transport system fused permease subunit
MRLAFAAYLVPWAFVFNPGILMIGSPLQIMKTFFFVLLGAISIGVAFEGYLFTRLRRWENMLLALSGLCIFIPSPITRAVGLAYQALFLLSQIMRTRRMKSPKYETGENGSTLAFAPLNREEREKRGDGGM